MNVRPTSTNCPSGAVHPTAYDHVAIWLSWQHMYSLTTSSTTFSSRYTSHRTTNIRTCYILYIQHCYINKYVASDIYRNSSYQLYGLFIMLILESLALWFAQMYVTRHSAVASHEYLCNYHIWENFWETNFTEFASNTLFMNKLILLYLKTRHLNIMPCIITVYSV